VIVIFAITIISILVTVVIAFVIVIRFALGGTILLKSLWAKQRMAALVKERLAVLLGTSNGHIPGVVSVIRLKSCGPPGSGVVSFLKRKRKSVCEKKGGSSDESDWGEHCWNEEMGGEVWLKMKDEFIERRNVL
jgi:hypothetical protein